MGVTLTVKEVAERLRLSVPAVYQLCAEQKLGHLRLGVRKGVIRVREEDLEAYIEACTVASQDSANASKQDTGSE
jgi:excisionase family DNA binding protein